VTFAERVNDIRGEALEADRVGGKRRVERVRALLGESGGRSVVHRLGRHQSDAGMPMNGVVPFATPVVMRLESNRV
jgi:hypothetical protein